MKDSLVPASAKILGAIAYLCHQNLLANDFSFFRNAGTHEQSFAFKEGAVSISFGESGMEATADDSKQAVQLIRREGHEMWVLIGNHVHWARFYVSAEGVVNLWSGDFGQVKLHLPKQVFGSGEGDSIASGSGRIIAPMPCKISQIAVKPGQRVKVGTTLCITEAMKMEQIIKSDVEGVVERIHFAVGEIVPDQSVLVTIKKE